MIIQSRSILRRLGSVTASGIQVVPDPILSMLTPAGPIIMSSVVCPGMTAMPAIPVFVGIPAIPGMFMRAEAVGDMSTCVESVAAEGFLVCVPLGMFMGILDFAVSRAVCGC